MSVRKTVFLHKIFPFLLADQKKTGLSLKSIKNVQVNSPTLCKRYVISLFFKGGGGEGEMVGPGEGR
jgi:hypothetical protein